MSRFTRHSLIGLPEPLPDSPGGANQEGVVRKVFALRRCAPVPGCAGWVAALLAAPCLRAPAGLQRAAPSGPPPLAVGHPLRGPLRGRASAFPGSPTQARFAQPVSGRGVALSRCSTAVPAARPLLWAGWERTCPPVPGRGRGRCPHRNTRPSRCARSWPRLCGGSPSGLRPAPGCAPTPGLRRPSRCARSWPAPLGVGSPFRLTGLATGQPPAPAARHGRGRVARAAGRERSRGGGARPVPPMRGLAFHSVT